MAKLRLAITALILLSLPGLVFSAGPAAAAADAVSWSGVNIPTEGKAGGYGLAGGSDVGLPTMAADGSLYAYVSGFSHSLYKSTDGGRSWSETGGVTGAIVDIAADKEDGNTIYYATGANVYRSTDGGQSFTPLAGAPGGAGSDNIEITAIGVARLGDSSIVVVSTRDTDAGNYGGVYVLDEGRLFPDWQDTSLSGFDVYAVAFSPHFAADRQMVAVVTDEVDSFVTTNLGGAGWGVVIGDARLDRDNSGASVAVAVSAAIAFPDDYSSEPTSGSYVQFVAIDSGGGSGDVYMVFGVRMPAASVAIDLNIGANYGQDNIDVTSLEVSGNAAGVHLLAGAAAGGQVYRSLDSGANWSAALKAPTGNSKTYVLMAPGFIGSGQAYAATSGAGSTFSTTSDGGASWNQLSLIDTTISSIVDLAVSPRYDQDSSLFLLTWGSEFSLWRSTDGGESWLRVFSSSPADVGSLDLVQLSPQYGENGQVVFIAGSSGGNAAIWRSADNGQSFSRRSAPLAIDCWAVVDDTSLFFGAFDGFSGLVYYTANSGLSYSSAPAGEQSLYSIALSPGYEQDGAILVGNTNGWVYYSDDRGASFEPLPQTATSPPLTGSISVVFDPGFADNSTVYAASDSPDEGIYRFVIGASSSWQSIDGSLPAGAMIRGLTVSEAGVLYGANFQQVAKANGQGGMERSLSPTGYLGATFETVTRRLDDGATLWGLWLFGSQLWSIDSSNIRLMTYYDTLTRPVNLTSPLDEAPGIGTIINDAISDVRLDWESLSGATSYQWQLDDDNDFSSIPGGFEGAVTASSVSLPGLSPDTTYYWRVRAAGPVLSPWSARWSFTTSLGGEIVTLSLMSPLPGARDVPLRPLFQWTAVAGANGYELVVSGDVDFANPSVLRIDGYALPGNAWQSDISLNYDTTYYWQVRAVSAASSSAWSAVGVFTTRPPPAAETEPAAASSPPASPPAPAQPVLALSDETVYVIVFLGAVIILLLATILVMVARRY